MILFEHSQPHIRQRRPQCTTRQPTSCATRTTRRSVRTQRFEAGDVFVTPSGWKGVWRVHETLRKHYTIVND
ncbi:MAG: cupin domain-containing protein [Actinobacteria bacterium]|nr:cupin domain-containing protein [Actinomycetota bacterium]